MQNQFLRRRDQQETSQGHEEQNSQHCYAISIGTKGRGGPKQRDRNWGLQLFFGKRSTWHKLAASSLRDLIVPA